MESSSQDGRDMPKIDKNPHCRLVRSLPLPHNKVSKVELSPTQANCFAAVSLRTASTVPQTDSMQSLTNSLNHSINQSINQSIIPLLQVTRIVQFKVES
jgi:hypothetical protein